jgi:hypothetical protein
LNQDWLAGASAAQVIAVLTEELGHHLDGLLNVEDTPGDEGEWFSRLLTDNNLDTNAIFALKNQTDVSRISVSGALLTAELAAAPNVGVSPTASANLIVVDGKNTTLSIELDISEASGFGDDGYGFIGGINLAGPSGQSIYLGLSKTDIVAQVNNTATFKKVIELGIATQGGKWYISGINLTDKHGNRRDAWLQGAFEGGTPTHSDIQNYLQALGLSSFDPAVTVVNTGSLVDTSSPTILSLRTSAPVVNVTNGNSALSIELDISEASGFGDDGYGFIGGINLAGPSGQSVYLGLGKTDIIAQVNNTATFRKTIELGVATPGGKWYIAGINLTDKYGNRRDAYLQGVYGGGTPTQGDVQDYLRALGLPSFDPAVTVVNTGSLVDTSSPTILSLRTSAPAINVTNGNSALSIELDVSEVSGFDDDGYGVIGGINLAGPSGQSIYLGLGKADIIAQVNNTATFRKTIELGVATPGGKWYISGINLTDKYGNRRDAYLQGFYGGGTPTQGDIQDYLRALGLSSVDPSFTVVNAGTLIDANSPTVAAFRISSDNASLPYVVLALSPSSATEYGSANLLYTFSRTGDTVNPLTVNYSIAGTADAFDYAGATPGAGKFITFAAGSATAILTIDPTADTSIETDETVALTLAAGTGYTVGTTATVVGRILNSSSAPGSGPDTLAPTIQGFSLNSSSFNPSQPGGAYISGALRFSDNLSGFDYGYINFRSMSSGQIRSGYFGKYSLQGTTLAGTSYASAKLDLFTAPGSWALDSIELYDSAGNGFSKNSNNSDWNAFLGSSGITQASFQVDYGPNPAPGIGSDTLAPTIQGFSLNSASLDPSQPGGAYISGALRFSDNLSGFDYGSISFRSTSSGETRVGFFDIYNLQGTTLAGTLYASAKLDPFTAAGSWVLNSIDLYDKAGNKLNKNSGNSDWNTFLSSSGITQTSFQVSYGPNPTPGSETDNLAPTIQGFSLDSSSFDPAQPGGAFLSGRLSFRDNASGYSYGSLGFSSDSGQSIYLRFSSSNIISGTELSGVAFASIPLNAYAATGTWRLTSVSLSDQADNNLYKSTFSSDWNSFLSSSGITQTSFQVAYGPNPAPGTVSDTLAPTIQSFSLDSSSFDPSQPGGAFLSGRLSFRDNLSGYSYGSLTFSSESGQSSTSVFIESIISGTELSGVAFGSTQLNPNAAAGTWRLTSVSLTDNANNTFYKYSSSSDWNSFLSSSGITQTSFQVAYGSVTDVNQPPTALAFANATSSLAENSSTSVRIKVADIIITDDALGTEVISISGADAGSFELDGNSLYLKAGTVLNYEAKSTFAISVSARDLSLPGSTPVSAAFNLSVANVNEVPGTTVVTTVASIATPTGVTRQIPVTISGGSLSLGTELAIVPVSGINQESLAKLNQSGVTRNSTAVDFVIDIAPGQDRASLAASLDLVAADLLPQLGDASGRLSSRKLLYYALNSNTGTASPLTYDPITGAGARFYDLTNDGTPDFFALSLIDGGHGDKDGAVNGKIYDSSFAGFVDLSNIGFSSPAAGLLTVAQSGNAAPGAVSLRANLSGRSSTSNHIGYVVLTPDELTDSANLLNDFNWLRGRAKTLFSSLESTDVTLPVNTSFDRDILLINGQSLRFFEVQDASLDQITSLGDSRFRYLNPASFGNGQASFSSSSGVGFSLGILPGDPGLNALIGEAQAQAPVLDLSALTAAQSLQGAVAMGREAEYNSVVGFYRTLDAQGTIVAADGLTRLRPGDLDYGAAALRADNLVNQLGNLSAANNQTSSRSFVDLTGGSFLAPYALVNGNTFFAYGAANGDGISHFRSLGNNLFGLEDLYGGGDLDYDDLVISFNFASLI